MKKAIISAIFIGITGQAQTKKDSTRQIEEVKISALIKKQLKNDLKVSVSVDEYLASVENISFIKRGAYAWEPLLNNMSTERSVITIDGMHIFGACTDKMDPVSSYVESNNLAGVEVSSGQQGGMNGATIAGSIDLKRRKVPFSDETKIGGSYQSIFEFNNQQTSHLGDLYFSNKKWAADASIGYRMAKNYTDGSGNEVKHSQFNKLNTSMGMSYKMSPLSSVRIDAIFDMAKDVGYPALPMDLWLSRALITSASYKQLFLNSWAKAWETKAYFNTIEHYMDDTTRPENLVHMDMPGWSTTYGLTSKLSLSKGKYRSEIQLNTYQNESISEMTMYPQDRNRKLMFAFSWPYVTTQFLGVSAENQWEFSDRARLSVGGGVNWHYNYSKYAEFNRIFHPNSSQEKTRILPSLHSTYYLDIDDFSFSLGLGYGHRAPSVSEGYGYYIYNSFDRYDYIGNPDLKNEISYESNLSIGYKKENLSVELKGNYFHIDNYIIGKILNVGSPMNYQSTGVKGYTSLDFAKLYNLSFNFKYDFAENWQWK
ncbi:MAG: TonB-dependent receptor, partial [Bergeyella zoohelcum]|nr:TonB-dependent receptor [Bergeyella zoohelcum]